MFKSQLEIAIPIFVSLYCLLQTQYILLGCLIENLVQAKSCSKFYNPSFIDHFRKINGSAGKFLPPPIVLLEFAIET